MEERLDLPRQFQLTYQAPNLGKQIAFSVYREPGLLTWNGYYKEQRIRIWNTGDVWVVAGYVDGIQACYFRTDTERAELTMINKLVQCACYYIDTVKTNNEEQCG